MPTGGAGESASLRRVGPDACRELLASRSFGRVCFNFEDRVVVVMTTYVMRGSLLHFRAAAFGPVVRRVGARSITVQVDDGDQDRQATWSVSVFGTPIRVTEAATLVSLWSEPRPQIWEAGMAPQWLTLGTGDLEGRQVNS